MIRFIDRDRELALLEEEWKKKGAQFVVVYGRRRIGKTALITEFIKDKNGIFYIAEDTNKKVQINDFKEKLSSFFNDELLKTLEIKEWKDLFAYLEKILPRHRKMHITIDEFSYLIKNDPGLVSALQKFWDGFLLKTEVFLLVSGSIFGLMSERMLSASSPLYGRRTRDMLLRELSFKNACEFLKMPFEDMMQVYMAVGGIPEYLLKAAHYSSFNTFFEKEFTSKDGYFYREPFYLLSQEFKEIKTYFTILNAIAYGNTKPSEIANFVGIKTREIYPYLENLIRLNFIEKITPIAGVKKSGIYLIKDAFFDCWFNFVYKHREDIERDRFKRVQEDVQSYFGKRFEGIARNEFAPQLFKTSRIGKWWHKENDIDIVALDEHKKQITFVECKWKTLSYTQSLKILENLKEKADFVEWCKGDRKERYGIIARKIEHKHDLREKGFFVYDSEEWKFL
ncbi:MAG: ATP-binding protein [Candidatus Thermoplasmatota archaeon]